VDDLDELDDKVRIVVDWNMDGTVDLRLPAGFEQFGVSPLIEEGRMTWTEYGEKTFQARAIDEYGVRSEWKQYKITLTNPNVPQAACGTKQGNYPASQTSWTIGATDCASDNTVVDSSPIFPTTKGSTVSWTCKNNDSLLTKSCQAYRSKDGEEGGAPKVKLKIQPKVAPSCVARLVHPESGNPITLKDYETCNLVGPDVNYTFTKDNANSTTTKNPGLYTLTCKATTTGPEIVSTDVCISNPTTIER
jgi:hypothetical protein